MLLVFCVDLEVTSIEERMIMTVSEIVKVLIRSHQEGKELNLNRYIVNTYGRMFLHYWRVFGLVNV